MMPSFAPETMVSLPIIAKVCEVQRELFQRAVTYLALVSGALSFVLPALADEPIRVIGADLPPYLYTANDGSLAGPFAQPLQSVNQSFGDSSPIDVFPWRRALAELEGSDDVIMGPLARTPGRESRFKWIKLIITDKVRFFSYGRPAISGLVEASAARSIGVRDLSPMQEMASRAGLTNQETIESDRTTVRMLAAGRIDGWLTTGSFLDYWARAQSIDLANIRVGPPLGTIEVYVVASPRMRPDMVTRIAESLSRISYAQNKVASSLH